MRFLMIITFVLAMGSMLPFEVAALTISPVRVELFGDPGAVVKGEIILINEQEGTRTFYSSFENFEASGESGTPSFVEGLEGLATWIETVPDVTLAQDEKQEVPYTITIPQDADPGGHFAAIFWSTSPPKTEQGGGVSIGAKVGVLILLKVSGEIEEGGGVLEFSAKDKQKFFSSLPVIFIYRFQNGGDDRIKPEGEITIKNMFGRTSAILPANRSEGNVLPQSIRKFEMIWEKEDSNKQETVDDKEGFLTGLKREWNNFAFGRYTAELNLEYGTEGETAQASFSFFIIPWRILGIILFILAVLVFSFIIGIKKYNKWIIAKAKGE